MEEKKTLEGGITQNQLEEWKRQYIHVSLISVPIDDTGETLVHGYFRKPSLETICLVAMYEEANKFKCIHIVMENCFLGGDTEFKHNGEVQISAYNQVLPMFRTRAATIKNL
jgi:hypothetical protein